MRPLAVSFDFWNTLVVGPQGLLSGMRREAVAATLAEHGVELAAGDLDRHLELAWSLHLEAWEGGRGFHPREAATSVAEAIEELDAAGRERVADAFLQAGRAAPLRLTPNAAETVAALSEAGVRLGIVCDVGLTGSGHLRAFLDRQGLLRHFDGWAFSDEVGRFKPAPEIFAHMLGQLAIEPGPEVWHVGDLRRTDVAGARAAGLTTVRYRGIEDDDSDLPEADRVIDDLSELLAELG
ncbi:MAG TPA: HAD family hydrolase [Solirubrobacterales bacterium]|nr:HAD family hydrolase [Solirubrobacterales bacterium]